LRSARTVVESLERAPSRDWLLAMLREIIELAMNHVRSDKVPRQERIKWSRILIAASQVCNSVLRDVEIETLKEQIRELKELTVAKSGDEPRGDQEGDPEAPAKS